MKRVWVLLTASFLLIAVHASGQSKTFEKTVRVSPGGTLDLSLSKGSVRLTAWDRDDVEIHARIEADGSLSSEAARRMVDGTEIDVTTTTSRVIIRPDFSRVPTGNFGILGNWGTTPKVHFEVRAPMRMDIDLNVDRSDTVISGFEGRIVLTSDRSEVQATALTGNVRATMDRSGNSKFSDIRGSINVVADRTNLLIGFTRVDSGSRIAIDRGDVEVSVTPGQGLDFAANLSKRSSFDTNLQVQYRNRNSENRSGSVNGGGPRLEINADRGRVRLRG